MSPTLRGTTERCLSAPTTALLVLGLVLGLGACEAPRSVEPGARESHDHESEAHAGEEHAGHRLVELSPEARSAAEIVTAPVERHALTPRLETTGEVGYDEDRIAHVSPRIPGRVHRVEARLGDRVDAGAVLAVLDSIELGRARADFLSIRAHEAVARQNYERERRLYADRITSEKELLQARAALIEAEAERESAEETLHLYGLSEDEVEGLAPDQPGASLLEVRAPFSGRVVEKHATLGELVTPEENLFTLADLSRLWVWIDVYERDLAAVHLGDGVEVTVDAYPGRRFTGEVSYLGPEVAVETRTVRARIDVGNPERLLRPGMFARVRLSDPHVEAVPALVVPESAVERDGAERIVFVATGEGRYERRPVELGRTEDDRVEILSGLEAGESVVVQGGFVLKSELSRGELGGGHHH